MATSEADRQSNLKSHFSSYKGSNRSGDSKLEAFRNATSGSNSSTGEADETPEEYAAKTAAMSEEEKAANRLISGAGEASRTQQALNQLQQQQSESTQNTLSESTDQQKLMVENSPFKPEYLLSEYSESDYRSHLDSDKSIIGIIKSKVQSANEYVSSYIPTLDKVQEKGAEFRQSHPEAADVIWNIADTSAGIAKNTIDKDTGEAVGHFSTGFYNEVQSNPVGIGVTAAAIYGGGAALKVVSTGGRVALGAGADLLGSSSTAAKGLSLLSKSIEPAIAIGGLTLTANEINNQVNAPITTQTNFYDESGNLLNTNIETSEPTTAEKAERLGEITPNLLAGLYGGVKGWNAGSRIVGRLQTVGRTEIPLESITDVSVAEGKQTFPLTQKGQTPSNLVAEFKADSHGIPTDTLVPDKYGVWHATANKLASGTEVANNPIRPTDVGGLYVSPRLSPAFTRLTSGRSYSLSDIVSSEPVRPSAARIYVSDVQRLPTGSNVAEGQAFLTNKAELGKAYLTPNAERLAITGSVESEATIAPGTKLIQTNAGRKYFTLINGRRVPIDTYVVDAAGNRQPLTASQLKSASNSISSIAESSYLNQGSPLPKLSYITPASESVRINSEIISSSNSISESAIKSSSVLEISSSVSSSSSRSSSIVKSGRSSVSSSRSASSGRSSSGSNSAIIRRSNKNSSELIQKPKLNLGSSKKKSLSNSAWKYKRARNEFSNDVKIKTDINVKRRS